MRCIQCSLVLVLSCQPVACNLLHSGRYEQNVVLNHGCVKPNTQRRRRRDETVASRRRGRCVLGLRTARLLPQVHGARLYAVCEIFAAVSASRVQCSSDTAACDDNTYRVETVAK